MNEILDFKPLTFNNVTSLKAFLDVHQNAIQALKALSLDDLVFLSLALCNLDTLSRKSFEDKQKANMISSHEQLLEFKLHLINSS